MTRHDKTSHYTAAATLTKLLLSPLKRVLSVEQNHERLVAAGLQANTTLGAARAEPANHRHSRAYTRKQPQHSEEVGASE
jgi:hypothetical protein